MTLLAENNVPDTEPAVHALVVAAGTYPHLIGGQDPSGIDTAGMGQLSSPPHSARKLASWLMNDFKPCLRAIGTVDVICSGTADFVDAAGNQVDPEPATLANLEAAIDRWYLRASAHPENLALFYFCGHGVTSGSVDSILLEDFGKRVNDPFGGAVDATAFCDGMRKCPARNQLLMFDACRTAPEEYLREFGTKRGAPLINAAQHTNLGRVKQHCLWASELGLPAYGRPGAPSIFVDALLASMQGASAMLNMSTGAWQIESQRLMEGLNAYIARATGRTRQYATQTRMSIGFPLHLLDGEPIVPVDVSCLPQNRANQIHLRCTSGHDRPAGENGPWRADLPYGNWQVEAIEAGTKTSLKIVPCPVSPPAQQVVISL